jgi:hypothetical protein
MRSFARCAFFCAKEAQKMYQNYHIAPGTKENWQLSFANGNIWGLPEWHKPAWQSLQRGEVVFFYVESPLSVVIGFGEIQDAFIDATPFFADDWGHVSKWPLRFRFQIVLPPSDPLKRPGVLISDMLKFPRLKRFEQLTKRQGEELLQRCQTNLNPGPMILHG